MADPAVFTLDLNFLGRRQAIASYLIPHSGGAVLVESGPGSTIEGLKAGLAFHGLTVREITHVLLTHIHLDHAGAAGWLARQGATIIVHPVGAPHLIDPQKLLASAARIYGDKMDALWGEFLPVPEKSIFIPRDREEIVIGNLHFVPLNTPGHAEHHYAYLFGDTCFTGDIGGVRIPGYPYLRLPMPPPEFVLEKWRESLTTLRSVRFRRIAPTHFGIFDDPDWHLDMVWKALDDVERWLEEVMLAAPPIEELREKFTEWMDAQGRAVGLDPDIVGSYELANPLGMSADGLQRYWLKYRMPEE
jgi:glyoxylase-like metal-dependent hydrolase (beta-lactamase superfamily II)